MKIMQAAKGCMCVYVRVYIIYVYARIHVRLSCVRLRVRVWTNLNNSQVLSKKMKW